MNTPTARTRGRRLLFAAALTTGAWIASGAATVAADAAPQRPAPATGGHVHGTQIEGKGGGKGGGGSTSAGPRQQAPGRAKARGARWS